MQSAASSDNAHTSEQFLGMGQSVARVRDESQIYRKVGAALACFSSLISQPYLSRPCLFICICNPNPPAGAVKMPSLFSRAKQTGIRYNQRRASPHPGGLLQDVTALHALTGEPKLDMVLPRRSHMGQREGRN